MYTLSHKKTRVSKKGKGFKQYLKVARRQIEQYSLGRGKLFCGCKEISEIKKSISRQIEN
jgi:hypothetical protein